MFKIRKSPSQPNLLEVWKGEEWVQEFSVSFRLRRIPPSFDSLEEIAVWLEEQERKQARQTAYRLLAMRSYPSVILARKLSEKGFSPKVCQPLIEELQENGYLQDAEFESQAILREFKRGYGPRYIEAKMRSKGFSGSQVRKLITLSMQEEKIQELLRKLGPKEKAFRILQRRGFDLDCLRRFLYSSRIS